ncbi:hypothetical protein NDA14_005503 [Ustilago hordei]|uniref:Uncharacterized protein n=1 Tax=Ustilago hordei TaxID=120017 RepID=I2FNF1_USTHO|nr:hypothetical protein NDA10_003951 [Ustilago hordei]KAJ1604026.1 hypothetical protein NDA14_005503 [Ustilago hordei]UTT88481.1 hypothetical protein NDA17_003104 [Ustilago hordei]CCF48444.1 uncharacterized protein UHOR_13183 [Ustilago hordei]
MVEETETPAGVSKAKGGRRGKTVQPRGGNEAEAKVHGNDAGEETNSDSDLDDDSKHWSAHIKLFLRTVPNTMKHLEGVYNKKHPKWSCMFNDVLTNALCGTVNTTREHNINYLILDIIREYHTFHQVWKKIESGLTNEATATSCQLALITQLGDVKMFNSNAQKLIQEIRAIQTESSLLGKPFSDNTLFSNLQKCTICHPTYKETIATINQLNFNALATALIICQSAIENNPAQKVDPHQASTRVAGSDDQGELTEKDEKDDDQVSAKAGARPRRIRCWVCKHPRHGIKQCNASVTIPDNSPLAKSD